MSMTGYQAYKTTGIETASPQYLVYLLYNEAYKQAALASVDIEEKRIPQANERLLKVQAILTELMGSLDFNYPIAEQLYQVYDFLYREMVQANVSKDVNKIEGVLPIIKDLRDTWKQAFFGQNTNDQLKAKVISV
jgi:flagellar protein FliS